MTRRHEKIKPHLVRQYTNQAKRLEECRNYAIVALNMHYGYEFSSFFSTRFKK